MMKADKIRDAFLACRTFIALDVEPERGSKNWRRHLVFMCIEGASYAEHRREKAMRWLGFVQGALWAHGLASIEEMKAVNRPDFCEKCGGAGRYSDPGGIQWCGACKGTGGEGEA